MSSLANGPSQPSQSSRPTTMSTATATAAAAAAGSQRSQQHPHQSRPLGNSAESLSHSWPFRGSAFHLDSRSATQTDHGVATTGTGSVRSVSSWWWTVAVHWSSRWNVQQSSSSSSSSKVSVMASRLCSAANCTQPTPVVS